MMNCDTQRGLLFLIIGSIMTIICSAITSISSFFTENTVTSTVITVFGIASLIGPILILIGVIFFLIGRKEFGEKHQKNVMNAIIIFVIYVSVTVMFGIMLALMTIPAVLSGNSNSTFSPNIYFTIIFSIIIAVLGSLIYYFALVELENETGKTILYLGILSSIIISIVTSIYLTGLLSEIFGSVSTENLNYSSFGFTQNIGLIGILGIIPTLLFLFSYYIPYKRIKDGELVPFVSSVSRQGSSQGRICTNCGKSIPADSMLCPYCGKNLSEKSKNIT